MRLDNAHFFKYKNKTTMKQNQHFEMTAAFLMGASIILSIIYLATI